MLGEPAKRRLATLRGSRGTCSSGTTSRRASAAAILPGGGQRRRGDVSRPEKSVANPGLDQSGVDGRPNRLMDVRGGDLLSRGCFRRRPRPTPPKRAALVPGRRGARGGFRLRRDHHGATAGSAKTASALARTPRGSTATAGRCARTTVSRKPTSPIRSLPVTAATLWGGCHLSLGLFEPDLIVRLRPIAPRRLGARAAICSPLWHPPVMAPGTTAAIPLELYLVRVVLAQGRPSGRRAFGADHCSPGSMR